MAVVFNVDFTKYPENEEYSILSLSFNTALYQAAESCDWNTLKTLLETSDLYYTLDGCAFDSLCQKLVDDLNFSRLPEGEINKIFSLIFLRCYVKKIYSKDNTLLHLAIIKCRYSIARVLINLGANMEVKDGEGFGIMHRLVLSTSNSCISLVKFLLRRNIRLDTLCPNGKTAVELAKENKKWYIAKLLHDRMEARHYNIMDACHHDRMEAHHHEQPGNNGIVNNWCVVKEMLILEARGKGGRIVKMAAKSENWDLVEDLLNRHYVATELDDEQNTILHHLAASNGMYEWNIGQDEQLCYLMVARGVDIQARNKYRYTALELAGINSKWQLVKCILKNTQDEKSKADSYKWVLHTLAKDVKNFSKFTYPTEVLDLILKSQIDVQYFHPNEPVNIFAKLDCWDYVLYALKRTEYVSIPDKEGYYLIHRLSMNNDPLQFNCIMSERLDIVIMLIQKKVDVNIQDPDGNTPIQLAAKHWQWGVFEVLLPFVEDVNKRDSEGFTILHRLASSSLSFPGSSPLPDYYEHSFAILFDMGADIGLPCPSGETVLHLAVKNHVWYMVTIFLEQNIQNADDYFILHELVKSPTPYEFQFKFMQKFISYGLDVNKADSNGKSVILLAAERGKWKIVDLLVKNGSHVGQLTLEKASLFHWVAHTEKLEELALLICLDGQLDITMETINQRNDDGDTPLHVALRRKKLSVVKFLAQLGADATLYDKEGLSVFQRLCSEEGTMHAFSKESDLLEILTILFEKGIDINIQGQDGKTAIQTALSSKNWKVFKLLVDFGARYEFSEDESRFLLKHMIYDCKEFTSQERQDNFLKYILGINPERRQLRESICEDTENAFCGAVQSNNWSMVKAFLRCNVVVNQHSQLLPQPILHALVDNYSSENHEKWISDLDSLLALGLDINFRCKWGTTPLQNIMQPTRRVHLIESIVPVLIDRGADPLVTDSTGFTVLRYAVRNWHNFNDKLSLNMIRSLLRSGMTIHQPQFTFKESCPFISNVNVEINAVASPTVVTLRNGNFTGAKLLIEAGASSTKELRNLYDSLKKTKSNEAENDSSRLECLRILENAISYPRCLRSMCRLQILHTIGFCKDHQSRIRSLPLPPFIQDNLLFADVLPQEFQELNS